MATQKKIRRLKKTEVDSVGKAIKTAIIGCTKVIDSKDTIVFNDGTDAKKQFKGLRTQLKHLNDLFGYNIDWRK